MPLSNSQQAVADDQHRFRVLVCGRRWGKTTLAIREICKIAREPNKDVYYLAPTYRMAKTIAWKRLKNKLSDLRWIKKLNETELSITLKNNSTISLKGTENYDSIRGVSLSAAVFDEFAFMDPDVWDVVRPALADQQGSALFITTPVGKNNWAFDLYNMQDSFPEDWRSFTYTTLQGGFVTESEITAAREQMSEKQFKQEFEASFETANHLIAWAFSREHNIKNIEKPDLSTIHVGLDFNVTPGTACVMVRQGQDLYVIDELYLNDTHTGEIADELRRRYPMSQIIAYPDPAGSARKTSSGGLTDHAILRNAGFTVKAPSRHNAVKDRINSLNARLCNANGVRHLFIDSGCKYTLESLEKYAYKPGTLVPDKGGKYDFSHMFDAMSYAVDFMFPLKQEHEPQAPQRWGHALA
jgi:phage terminase large subunit